MIRFGPSGNDDTFYESGAKHSHQMPHFLHQIGLNAYEYQCSRGVKIGESTAVKLGDEAKKYDISLSIHAPYYINLATEDDRRPKSINYILDSLKAAKLMGAKRVVVHSGACANIDRTHALNLAKETLLQTLASAQELGLSDIYICPETMGKINQLGTLSEVLEMCSVGEQLLPTIDFGHLYARNFGRYDGEDMVRDLEMMKSALGVKRAAQFHCHFSKIEYTEKGGEKRHLTLDNTEYGPSEIDFIKAIKQLEFSPVVICESQNRMTLDAKALQNIYDRGDNNGKN